MALRIVLDQAAVPGRGARRTRRRIAGFALIASTGILAVPLAVLTIGGLVAIAAAWGGQPFVPDEWVPFAWIVWVALFVLSGLARSVGDRWVRADRRLVLFLRRFGHTPATQAITAATGRVGGSWRFVTLDDDEIAAVGVGAASRGLVRGYGAASWLGRGTSAIVERVGSILGPLAFVGGVGSLIYVVAREPDSTDALTDWSLPASSTALLIFRIAVGAGGVLVAGLVAMIAYGVLAGLAVALFSPLTEARRSIEFAEKHKRLRANTEAGIDAIRGRIATLSRQPSSPRLYVVGVHSSIWQYTVRGFAADADLPLIDISEPTDNVLWEVRTILHWFGPRTVVVGEYAKLGRLFDPGSADRPAQEVMRLLDGVEVLAYTTDDAGQRRFVEALRHKLDAHAQLPLPVRSDRPAPSPRSAPQTKSAGH